MVIAVAYYINKMCVCLPEGEDDQSSDNKDCSKYNEDVVTGISPPSIVEHLCRLSGGERKKDFEEFV